MLIQIKLLVKKFNVSKHPALLEVLKVVDKGGALKAVGGSAGVLHTIGHAWWTTGEHTDPREEDVVFLQVVKEGLEVRAPEVGHRAQASEQTAARQLLEVPLTNVL